MGLNSAFMALSVHWKRGADRTLVMRDAVPCIVVNGKEMSRGQQQTEGQRYDIRGFHR